MGKQLALALLAFSGIFFFFRLAKNQQWVDGRIKPYYQQVSAQWANLDPTIRSKNKGGIMYNVSEFLCNQLDEGDRFLFPPSQYLAKSKLVKENSYLGLWMHPSVLYYHCEDLQIIGYEMSDSLKSLATHTFYVDPNSADLRIVQLANASIRNAINAEFDRALNQN